MDFTTFHICIASGWMKKVFDFRSGRNTPIVISSEFFLIHFTRQLQTFMPGDQTPQGDPGILLHPHEVVLQIGNGIISVIRIMGFQFGICHNPTFGMGGYGLL